MYDCILAMNWDGTMVLCDCNTEALQPGETPRDHLGQLLLQSRPKEGERLVESLNFVAKECLGRTWVDPEYTDRWLRDHLGQVLVHGMETHVLVTNPWQKVLENQIRRIFGVASPDQSTGKIDVKKERKPL